MLLPMKSKRASEVASCLGIFIGLFGPPEILQIDNGKEFKGACLILFKRFGIRVIYGRPRRPQTQGGVEQANGTVKTKISSYLAENGTTAWASCLASVMLSLNLQPHESLPKRVTPYVIMFSRQIKPSNRPPQKQRTELIAALSDERVDELCTEGTTEIDPLVEQFITGMPREKGPEDEVADEFDEVNEVKKLANNDEELSQRVSDLELQNSAGGVSNH